MSYIELELYLQDPIQPNMEIVSGLLAEQGFAGFQEDDNKLFAYAKEGGVKDEQIDSALSNLADLGLVHPAVAIQLLEEQNWNKVWEHHYFEPITVANKIYVRGSFHKPNRKGLMEIIIDPKMSFGTGHHHTTKMMMENMLDLDFAGKRVMDMGTGTGILAILASYMKAKHVRAVDVDDWAVENSKENILVNNTGKIYVEKGDVGLLKKYDEQYDCFIANINYSVLMEDIPQYVEYIDCAGHLILSGFLTEDIPNIHELCEENGLQLVKENTSGEWASLVYRKM